MDEILEECHAAIVRLEGNAVDAEKENEKLWTEYKKAGICLKNNWP